jgi:hypothetical protein
MKRSAWALVGVVLLFIGLIASYAIAPAGERGGKTAPAVPHGAH